jgi:hypothetical protein
MAQISNIEVMNQIFGSTSLFLTPECQLAWLFVLSGGKLGVMGRKVPRYCEHLYTFRARHPFDFEVI